MSPLYREENRLLKTKIMCSRLTIKKAMDAGVSQRCCGSSLCVLSFSTQSVSKKEEDKSNGVRRDKKVTTHASSVNVVEEAHTSTRGQQN